MPSKRLPPAGGSLKWDPGKASRSRFMFDFLSHLRHEVLPGSLGPFRLPYPAQMVRNAGVGLVILQWHKRKRKKNCAENIQTKRYEGTCGKRYQPNAPTTRVSTIIFHSAVAALYPTAPTLSRQHNGTRPRSSAKSGVFVRNHRDKIPTKD